MVTHPPGVDIVRHGKAYISLIQATDDVADPVQGAPQPMRLTLSEAQAVIEAVIAEITSLEKVVGVTVVDVRGDPLAAARMDGAAFYLVDISRGKALVSAMFGKPSAEYEAAAGTALMQQMSGFAGSPLVFRQGAVPLMKDGTVVGAVGVAGALSEEDERAALSGAATLS